MTLSIAQNVQHAMLDAITAAIGAGGKICLFDVRCQQLSTMH